MKPPKNSNCFHIIAFDPGGVTGYAHLVINPLAFRKPQFKVLPNIVHWETGEYIGSEFEQITMAIDRIRRARYAGSIPLPMINVVTEDFDLVQTMGGRELLSPVRINAVLDYQLENLFQMKLNFQSRTLRTGVTRERLKLWNLSPVKGKDAFAAMQHAVTWLRRVKRKANERPWK